MFNSALIFRSSVRSLAAVAASSAAASSTSSPSSSSSSCSSSSRCCASAVRARLRPHQQQELILLQNQLHTNQQNSFFSTSAAPTLFSSCRHLFAGAAELDIPPPPPPSSSGPGLLSRHVVGDIPDAPSSSGRPAAAQSSLALDPPASEALRDVAVTKCPLCTAPVHIKELLQHMHNFHPTFTDRDALRKLVRERYSYLHGSIKRVWSLSAPPGSLVNKLKGGFPCRHCPEDETGLRALFPTVDELMRHIGSGHDGVDLDEEEPPAKMTPEDVQVAVDRIRNGTGSGYPQQNGGGANGGDSSSVSVDDVMHSGAPDFAGGDGGNSSTLSIYRCEHCTRTCESDLFLMQHYEGSHPDVYFPCEGLVEELFGENGTATQSLHHQQQQFNWVCPVPAPWSGVPRKLVTVVETAAPATNAPAPDLVAADAPPAAQLAVVALSDGDDLPVPPAPESLQPQQQDQSVGRKAIIFRCEHCGRSSFSSQLAFADHLRDKHKVPQATATATAATAAANSSSVSWQDVAAQQQQKENSSSGYECVYCKRTFTTFAGLEEHTRKKHVGMPTPTASMPTPSASTPSSVASSSSSLESSLPPPPPISNSPPSLNIVPPAPPPSLAANGSSSATNGAAAAAAQAGKWWCNTCNRGFQSGQALLGHLIGKHAHRTQQLPCPGCKRVCPDPFSLLDHITKSHGSTKVDVTPYTAMCEGFRCEACGLRFFNQKELDTHELLTHVGQPKHHRPRPQEQQQQQTVGAQRWRSNF